MGKAEKIILGVILIAVIWVAYTLAQPPPQKTVTGGAPDFNLPVIGPTGPTGQSISLSSLHGRVVLLEFMSPGCHFCQNMAPSLEGLKQQFGASNIVFVAVAGPFLFGSKENDVANFIRQYGSTWTYVYDSSGMVFNQYNIQGTPTFYIIGKDGAVFSTYSGGDTPIQTLAADITRANG
jgi:thiol-disulfide isomerase/thioredoxin